MRAASQLISIAFHPLFYVCYAIVLLYILNPYQFGGRGLHEFPNFEFVYRAFTTTILFPFVGIMLMLKLGFIKSFEMEGRYERYGPLILITVFYLWFYVNIRVNESVPEGIRVFCLGTIIALFICFAVNAFFKISLHGAAIGGFLVFSFFIIYAYSFGEFEMGAGNYINVRIVPIIVMAMTGIILSARLWLQAHKPKEIIVGFFVGVFAQAMAINAFS